MHVCIYMYMCVYILYMLNKWKTAGKMGLPRPLNSMYLCECVFVCMWFVCVCVCVCVRSFIHVIWYIYIYHIVTYIYTHMYIYIYTHTHTHTHTHAHTHAKSHHTHLRHAEFANNYNVPPARVTNPLRGGSSISICPLRYLRHAKCTSGRW